VGGRCELQVDLPRPIILNTHKHGDHYNAENGWPVSWSVQHGKFVTQSRPYSDMLPRRAKGQGERAGNGGECDFNEVSIEADPRL